MSGTREGPAPAPDPAGSSQQVDAFFAFAPVGLAILDDNLRYVRVNDALAELNGLSAAEHVGRSVAEVLPTLAARIEPLIRHVFETGQPSIGHEIEGEQAGGPVGMRHALVSIFPIGAVGQRPATVGATVVDVTEHRRAEGVAREIDRRYRELTDSLPQTVFEIEPDGRLVFVNRQAYDLWGYAPEEVERGLNVLDLIVPAQRDQARANIRRALAGEVTGNEYLVTRKDGTVFPVVIHSRPARITGGALGLRGLVVDISEARRGESDRRQLQEQLRQAQKMEAIGRLAGGVAHDFNNVLTAILGYSEMAIESLDPADPVRADIQEIRKAAERASDLTRQLLTFSRRQTGQVALLDLNAVVAGIDPMLRRLIGEDMQFVTSLQPSLGGVRADLGQIEQVLMNLAVNARDAMPQGGHLTISTGNADIETGAHGDPSMPQGRYVVLSVRDTGCGMTADVKAHLFEPFFTTKERGKGTGLGLATVYGIVRNSGGRISVWSEPGEGSVFSIYLPRVEPDTEDAPPPSAR